jgi:tripartite ATP-independent transporter DctP family solute receptor
MKTLLVRVLAAAAMILPAVLAQAQPKQTLRISTPAAPEDWHVRMLSVFKDSLEKSAPGRFDVQIHHSGTLFKQGAETVAMQRGNLEMALISMQDVAKQVPELSLFAAGYLIRDPQHLGRVYNGPIGDEISQVTDRKMGIHLLQAVYYGTRQLGLRAPRKVRTPADLAGLKLRMPGSKEWLFLGNALGAQATPLPFPEVYMALKTGTIDAQDNPLPTVKAAKFSEVTKQIVLTSHLVDVLQIAISGKVWKALPEADRVRLKTAAQAAAKYNDENRLREEKELVEAFRKQGIEFTTPDVETFRRTVLEAWRKSEFAAGWPAGLFERVVAVK